MKNSYFFASYAALELVNGFYAALEKENDLYGVVEKLSDFFFCNKKYIIEQQQNFWHHRLEQKCQSDPSSAAINIEACTELPHTLLRITIVCSLFYHMKKLMSESSNKRTPIGTHHLLTSHPIQWEETEFWNFIMKCMHPI